MSPPLRRRSRATRVLRVPTAAAAPTTTTPFALDTVRPPGKLVILHHIARKANGQMGGVRENRAEPSSRLMSLLYDFCFFVCASISLSLADVMRMGGEGGVELVTALRLATDY